MLNAVSCSRVLFSKLCRDVMPWDDERTRLLIQLFRERRVLWDPSCEHFKDRKKQEEAWSDLSDRLDTPQHLLQRKIKKLVLRFDLEVDKRKPKRQHDLDQEWCFYRSLMFLRDRNVTINSTEEFGASDDDNVLEKAKIWDWVLLVASLLTVLYWHLIKQHGYNWGLRPHQDPDLTQPEDWINFNLDKYLSEEGKEICLKDWTRSTDECTDLALNYMLYKNIQLFTFKSKRKPESVLTTCVLSNRGNAPSDDVTCLTTVNATAFSITELFLDNATSSTHVCNTITTPYQ